MANVEVLTRNRTIHKAFQGRKGGLSVYWNGMTMNGREAVTFGMAWAMQRLRC
jgi:hypothetical protein